MNKGKFKPVDPKQDFVVMEKRLLKYWYEKGIVKKYLEKNRNSKKKYSFLDGPITANNPMGVHHAWCRTYKDLWQRFYNMQEYSQMQTEQSMRLGYFMDWDNSYHTSSDENNYAIWNFLKVCNQKGYLYKGRDSVPWCPRCGTAIS